MEIDTNIIKEMLKYVPKNPDKFEISGVLFDMTNNNVVATDLASLILYHDKSNKSTCEGEFIYHTDTLKAIASVGTKRHPETIGISCVAPNLQGVGTVLNFSTPMYDVLGKVVINGKYPSYSTLISYSIFCKNDAKKVKTIINNLEFEIAKTGTRIDVKKYLTPFMNIINDKNAPVTIYHDGTGEGKTPIGIEFENDDKIIRLLLMPIID